MHPFIFWRWKNIKDLRINEEIRVSEVRLLGNDGEDALILSAKEALSMAMQKGLDLVEISPNAQPPVCRIMDYGKYRFEQMKREKDAKRNQKITQLKEMKFRPNIGVNDFDTKAKNVERFLMDGDKVKITIMFRSREVSHPELGRLLCNRMEERLVELAVVEKPAKLEGRNMTIIFAPKAAK